MKLTVLSPEKELFSGTVAHVTLPGKMGSFAVFPRHAPLIAELEEGRIKYFTDGGSAEIAVKSGFVRVEKDNITVCAEQ